MSERDRAVVEAYRLRHGFGVSKINPRSSPANDGSNIEIQDHTNTPLKSPTQHQHMHHFTSPGTPTAPITTAATHSSPATSGVQSKERDQYKSIIESYQKTIAELRFKLYYYSVIVQSFR